MMEDLTHRLVSLPVAVKLLAAILGIFVIHISFRLLEKKLPQHFSPGDSRYRVRKFIIFLGYVIGILFMAVLFGDRLGRLGFALGIMGAGFAVALQEVIAGIAGWIAIGIGKLYAVGDRVQIGDAKGDVIDISPLRTTLMEIGNGVSGDLYNGRIARIPNGAVIKGLTLNYSQGFRFVWDEIKLRFTLDSDHVFARGMLFRIARDSVGDYMEKTEQSWEHVVEDFRVANLRREPVVTLLVVDGAYLEFTVCYVVDYLKRTVMKDQLFSRILEEVSRSESKVRWVSSPGPATPQPAPNPALAAGLAPSSSVAGAVAR